MFNKDVKIPKNIKKWQIAEAVGIADTTFSKWLRREMPAERKAAVLAAIQKLSGGDVSD